MQAEASLPGGKFVANVGGNAAPGALAFARSANTTPYPANSVVGGLQRFPNMGPVGAELTIFGSSLMIYDTALIASEASYLLHFYNAPPAVPLLDNAAWDLVAADRLLYQGFIALGTPVDLGSTLWIETDAVQKAISLAVGGTDIWAYLVTTAGYTPTSGRVYAPTIHTAVIGS